MTDEGSKLNPDERTEARQFARVAPLYDQLMHDVPYTAWIAYLHELLADRNAKPRRVLDLACGTGNVTTLLAMEGFSVVGVDVAAAMVAEAERKAREQHLAIPYFVQDAAELDLPGHRFDLCVSMFDSLNYVTVPERLGLAIDRVAAHLTRNGLLLFDMNSEYALKNRFFDQSNRATDARLRYEWLSEYFPDTRLCRVKMDFWYQEDDETELKFTEEHWQFAYREDEVVEMLSNRGFTNIATYQAYTRKPTTRTTDRIFYAARKGSSR